MTRFKTLNERVIAVDDGEDDSDLDITASVRKELKKPEEYIDGTYIPPTEISQSDQVCSCA